MKALRRRALDYGGILLVLIGMAAVFGLASDHFFTAETLVSIANQIPGRIVLVVGMTYVLIVGGIDLSIGSVMALCGAITSAALANWGWPISVALLAGALAGAVAGLVNGAVSFGLRIPSFIVTLGILEVARGLAYLVTDSRTIYVGEAMDFFSGTFPGGITYAFAAALLVVVIGQVLLSYTMGGRYLLGIGNDETAMNLSGINVMGLKTTVYCLMGILASFASLFHISRLEAADPNAGAGLELQVIAAAVIGGTSLMGGKGSVVNSFVGVIIMVILETGMAQLGVSESMKRLITGLVIILAVILDKYRNPPRYREA